jgi:hypothetical protein
MICPECEEQEITPVRIYEMGSTSTLLGWRGPYHDEDGRHVHDPNIVTSTFQCSNDHVWFTKDKRRCPNNACDWPTQ